MKRIKIPLLIFSIALISLALVQFKSIKTNRLYNRDIEELSFRSQKISQTYIVLNLLLNIETSSRGYLLTGIPTFLGPYEIAVAQLPLEIKKLEKYLFPKDALKVSQLIDTPLKHAKVFVEKKRRFEQVSFVELEIGKAEMDDLREAIREIVVKEEKYIEKKNQSIQETSQRIFLELVVGSLFSFGLVLLSVFYVWQEFKKRSEAERRLHVSLAISEAISKNIDIGVIASTHLGDVIFSNKWINDKVPKMKKVDDFFASNMLMAVPVKKMLSGEIDTIVEAELTLNNEKNIFTIHSSPFEINNDLNGIILSVVDTTQTSRRMKYLTMGKKDAEVASLAKSDFLAKMSHEIRTPLNAILGVGEILKLSKLNEEQAYCLEIFQRSAVTLNNLVNDILDISKIEAGKIELIKAPFSLKNLVRTCTSIMDFRASQKGLLFSLKIECDYDHFIGDEGRIRQILLNLLSNAIKFTEKGEIKFSIQCFKHNDQREIHFGIKDSGRGISPENVGKLFSNYQQENNKISSDYGGTGLGLSLSRELARLMGGDIEIQSQLGVGSEFVFHAVFDLAEGDFVEEKLNINLKLNKLKILLVDDNLENRFIIKKYLADFDIEIIEAVNGAEAIDFFNEDKFDLIFMDINMPRKDGLQATEEIRAIEKEMKHEKTIIIALSANAMAQEFTRARTAGCDDYLTKPISRLKLISMIKKWTGELTSNDQEVAMNSDEVNVDEEIKALIPVYLENRKKDVERLKDALIKKEIHIIAKIAHNIKGTAISYGQEALDHVAQELDFAAKENNWIEIEKLILKIEEVLSVKHGH